MQINNSLKADKIEKTICKLRDRIYDRFPESGLGNTCEDFHQFTLESSKIITWIDKPNFVVRIAVFLSVFLVLGLIGYSISTLNFTMKNTLSEIMTVAEASLNNIVLLGAAIFFLSSVEKRWKRLRAIKFLNEIRGFAHVVDMYQLTKDPHILLGTATSTKNSPQRKLTKFELQRYLDYCAEFLSLIGKVAALYAQSIPDEIVVRTSGEIEILCSNIANKVWQKLIILNGIKVLEVDNSENEVTKNSSEE